MIVEGIAAAFMLFLRGVVNLFLVLIPPVPGFATTAFEKAGQVFAVLDSFSTWLPVTFGLGVAAAVASAYVAAGLMVLVRMVVSYFTAGGGVT